MEQLENLLNLVKEAGFKAKLSYGKVNVFNDNDELIGQMVINKNNQTWFYVFDTEKMELTPEGGQFSIDVDGIKNIINEFRYR